jgi:hypothetical protein
MHTIPIAVRFEQSETLSEVEQVKMRANHCALTAKGLFLLLNHYFDNTASIDSTTVEGADTNRLLAHVTELGQALAAQCCDELSNLERLPERQPIT